MSSSEAESFIRRETIPGYEKCRLSEPYRSRVLYDQLIVKVLVEKCQTRNLLSHWICSGSGEWKVHGRTDWESTLSLAVGSRIRQTVDDDWSKSLEVLG